MIKQFKRSVVRRCRRLLWEDDGTTSVEYAFMIAMILGACMITVGTLARSTQESFNESADALNAAMP